MSLHILYSVGGYAGVSLGSAKESFLAVTIGDGQSSRTSIVIDGGTADECQDSVAIRLCVAEALQDYGSDALASRISVGGCIKRLAATVR
jgi:hypothetical protein